MPTQNQSGSEKAGGSLSYKYQRLRERLRGAIVTGELAGRLPGERVLAQRYEANAKTINKALADLATEGLILRHVGRGTFVAGGDSGSVPPASKSRKYGWLGGGTNQHSVGAHALFQQAVESVQAAGHFLHSINTAADSCPECPLDTLSPSHLRELSGVILFAARPSEYLLAEFNRRHLPAVIINNRHETIRVPVVQSDYTHGAFELTQHLIQLGHQDIRLVIDSRLMPAANDAWGGHRAAMGRYQLVALEPIQADIAFGWRTILDCVERPTALVCVGMELAIQAALAASEMGLAIPEQMSLAVIPEPGAPQAVEQRFTAYEVPSERLVDWAIKLLLTASPGGVPRMVVVPGRLCVRQSSARPIAGAPSVLATPGEAMV